MTKYLIVTADDFGRCKPINDAVEEGHRKGILTSASLMVTGEAVHDAVERAKKNPSLAVGLHITLVDGYPALSPTLIPHLIKDNQRFTDDLTRLGIKIGFSTLVRNEIDSEIKEQFIRYADFGLPLDHVDSHHHYHLHPLVSAIIFKYAKKFGAKAIRIPWQPPFYHWTHLFNMKPYKQIASALGQWPLILIMRYLAKRKGLFHNDRVFGLYESGKMDASHIIAHLEKLPSGLSEIYGHPATRSWDHHPMPDSYRVTAEYEGLIDPDVIACLKRQSIILTNFTKLQEIRGL
jgi:hopanoid biosynthesis associated protein HpnK